MKRYIVLEGGSFNVPFVELLERLHSEYWNKLACKLLWRHRAEKHLNMATGSGHPAPNIVADQSSLTFRRGARQKLQESLLGWTLTIRRLAVMDVIIGNTASLLLLTGLVSESKHGFNQ